MLARVVGAACSMSDNPQNDNILFNIRSPINKMKDLSKSQTAFLEIQYQEGSRKLLKLLKLFLSHRFLGIYSMLTRILECWSSVEAACSITHLEFSMSGHELEVEQLCALIKPIADLSTKVQGQNQIHGWRVVTRLQRYRVEGCLNEHVSLITYDGSGSYPKLSKMDIEIRKNLIREIDNVSFYPDISVCRKIYYLNIKLT